MRPKENYVLFFFSKRVECKFDIIEAFKRNFYDEHLCDKQAVIFALCRFNFLSI